MESDVFLSESLKTSYFLLQCILSQLLQDFSEANLDLIVPILYYFMSYPNICKFMFSKFCRFQDLLNKIYGEVRGLEKKRTVSLKNEVGSPNGKEGFSNGKDKEVNRKNLIEKGADEEEKKEVLFGKVGESNGESNSSIGREKREIINQRGLDSEEKKGNLNGKEEGEDLFEDSENPLEYVSSYVLNVDRNLLGFLPLNKFFKENKKAFFICPLQDQYDLKIRLVGYLMEKIGCKEEEKRKDFVDVNNLMPDLKEVISYYSYYNT